MPPGGSNIKEDNSSLKKKQKTPISPTKGSEDLTEMFKDFKEELKILDNKGDAKEDTLDLADEGGVRGFEGRRDAAFFDEDFNGA